MAAPCRPADIDTMMTIFQSKALCVNTPPICAVSFAIKKNAAIN